MEIQLRRFFGPHASRPLSALESFGNVRTLSINFEGYEGPNPNLTFLLAFNRIESLSFKVRPNEVLDFLTLPNHVRPTHLSISGLGYQSGARNIIGLSRLDTLINLEIIRSSGFQFINRDYPPNIRSLRLLRPMRFNADSLSGMPLKELIVIGIERSTQRFEFLAALGKLEQLSIAYASGLIQFPIMNHKGFLRRIAFDTLANLIDLQGLTKSESLKEVVISKCPKLNASGVSILKASERLERIICDRRVLAKELKAVMPPRIEVIWAPSAA